MSVMKRLLEQRLYGVPKPKTRKKVKRRKREKRIADGILISMGPRQVPYNVYLKTSHWSATRQRILKLDGFHCSQCGKRANQAHHLTYERIGKEEDKDLISVCWNCHSRIHEGVIVPKIPKRSKKKDPSKTEQRRRHAERQAAYSLRKAVRKFLNGAGKSTPEILRIIEVKQKKKQHRGQDVTIKSVMREMGHPL